MINTGNASPRIVGRSARFAMGMPATGGIYDDAVMIETMTLFRPTGPEELDLRGRHRRIGLDRRRSTELGM
jgi:hypothetical protein